MCASSKSHATCTPLSWDMVTPKKKQWRMLHDINLRWLLQRAREINLKLNKSKVNLKQTEVSFMTRSWKSEHSCKMPRCTCKKELRNLVGLLKYLSKFLPCLSMIALKEAAGPSGQHIRLNLVVPGFFVGRKTWKFKEAVRKWEMLAASKVKMSGSEK